MITDLLPDITIQDTHDITAGGVFLIIMFA